ncbi:MAG TPA: hypothetical protein PKU82_11050 [Bacteroidia bacterium]|nr:hypothetical protein [Bacteroidia bacterium]
MIIRYTVTVRNYHFNPPSQITKTEYDYYKQLVESNPKAKLNVKLQENPIKKGLKFAVLAPFKAISFLKPGVAEGEIKSAINKSKAAKAENEFYESLKECVIESESFIEFCELVKRKFPYYQ